MSTNFTENYVVIDIETTGFKSIENKIIELGALKVENGIVVDKYNTLINPKVKMNKKLVNITGITNDMVIDSPFIEDVLCDFLNFIGDSIILGHNLNFILVFLNTACNKCGVEMCYNECVDIWLLSKKVYPQFRSHTLKSLITNLDINVSDCHKPMDDCYANYKIYEVMKDYAGSNNIDI